MIPPEFVKDEDLRSYAVALFADRFRAREALTDIVRWGAKFDAKGTHSKRVVERASEALRPKEGSE